MRCKQLLIALLPLCSAPAFADTGVGLQLGTTGYGFDVSQKLTDSISARVGYSWFNYSHSFNTSDVDYDGKIKISNLRALADLELAFGFRLTGGLVFGSNEVKVGGRSKGGSYTINGNTYTTGDIGSFTGRVKLGRGAAPYLGVGYGIVSKKGFGFYADVGAMYVGTTRTTLDITCGSALEAAVCSQLKNDAEAERQKVQSKIDFKWYPVLNIGLSYAF